MFRVANQAFYLVLTIASVLGDQLPPNLRFGHFRTATRITLKVKRVPSIQTHSDASPASIPQGGQPYRESEHVEIAQIHCVLVTGSMDVGGVEAVVGLLARLLPRSGVTTDVVCRSGGRMANSLRSEGVRVVEVDRVEDMVGAIQALKPDVIQLHNAPPAAVEGLLKIKTPLVPVIHNIELYRDREGWRIESELAQVAATTIAVSAAVRDHHVGHLERPAKGSIVVVPNGAPPTILAPALSRLEARAAVSDAIGEDMRDDFLFVCLARFSIQKNVPGLVGAFLSVCQLLPNVRLIVAGEPEDWLEYRRADALRKSADVGGRISLLGNSDASTLLTAADGFILDSFFEGWPVSATEAAMVGLPLVMSDVGGARELVGTNGTSGRVIPNPSGDVLTRSSVARARRKSRQCNLDSLVSAVASVTREGVTRKPNRAFVHETMLSAHAIALREAAQRT